MKRRCFYLILIGVFALGLLACSNKTNDSPTDGNNTKGQENTDFNDSSDSSETKENASDLEEVGEDAITPEPTPVPDPFDESIWEGRTDEYKDMIKNSLITSGNNYRIKKAIEKAKRGEEVTIGYIGGSITESFNASSAEKGYAYLSYLYFKEAYGLADMDNVKYINAGMSGTPSTLGMIRYDRDIIGYAEGSPDILFVEFAVNDGDDPTNGDAYESLVLNALQAENQPAVILLFAVFQSKWNLQDRLMPVGNHYNLPMISIKDAVVHELEAERLTDKEFFSDQYHPTDYGHGIMADCIKYYFSTVNSENASETDITISDQAAIGNSFVGVKLLDASSIPGGITINPGSFSETDTILGTIRHLPGTKTFPNNWKHSTGSGTESFTMDINCKNLLIVYKSNSQASSGKVDVYIDGELTKSILGNQGGGWNNPYTMLLLNEDSPANHNVEIKMAEGNEEKEFTILAFGYTE
ncbi:MAG: SGNH/GDSL hydrolase family protein [Clostridiales bacterium]|nr:SGNH/GDSL hydrolase family protein [Clostridiales bacterium]